MSNREYHQWNVEQGCNYMKGALGIQLMIELHRRVHGNNFGSLPVPLKDDALSMSHQCLDAPEIMPAGGMRWEDCSVDFPDDEPNGVGMPVTFERLGEMAGSEEGGQG